MADQPNRDDTTLHIGPEDIYVNGQPFPCYLTDEPVTVVNKLHNQPDAVPMFEVTLTLLIPSGTVTIDPAMVVDDDGEGEREVGTRAQFDRLTAKDHAFNEFGTALGRLIAAHNQERADEMRAQPGGAREEQVRQELAVKTEQVRRELADFRNGKLTPTADGLRTSRSNCSTW